MHPAQASPVGVGRLVAVRRDKAAIGPFTAIAGV